MLLNTVVAVLATFGVAAAEPHVTTEPQCISHSQPNPIWRDYPQSITGTVNATMAILPIPYSLARSIIPKEYAILQDAYRAFLPNLPSGMYPALLQTVRDHDVRFGEYRIDDFSRASIEFPFVDLLNDGHTSFRWAPTMFLTATNQMAIHGAGEYGTKVYPSLFEPECNAYEYTSNENTDSTYLKAKSAEDASAFVDLVFQSGQSQMLDATDFPVQFFVNTTNQPSFADGKQCDQYVRFFNTSLSVGSNAAVPVVGTVRAKMDLFETEMVWEDAMGLRIDTAFIEHHLVSCQGLSGYDGIGEQKVEVAWTKSSSTTNSSFMPILSPIIGLQAVLNNYLIAPIKRAVS